jgi:putative transposase
MEIRRAYCYQLYPTPTQVAELTWTLDRCRELYNAGLEERRAAYRMGGILVSTATQQQQLPDVKVVRPEYTRISSQVLQDVLQRLDRAFAAFFRRVTAGQTPGFPRFKSRDRYNSFTFKQTSWSFAGTHQRLHLAGIGDLKVRWSRPIEGTIKTVTIRRDADQWYVCFSCRIERLDVLPAPSKPAVGIDMGLEHFASLSTGEHIANPRHFRRGQATLAQRQQAVARKQRGSQRRKKAKLLVAKAHRKMRNQRKDFHHKTANGLVHAHSLIVAETLQINNMVRRPKAKPVTAAADGRSYPLLPLLLHPGYWPGLRLLEYSQGSVTFAPNGAAAKSGLNKSISDAGWGQFLDMLAYKAVEAGVQFVQVNPAGTSQRCSGCGITVPKALDKRWHRCPYCGCSLQRDVNAARNILRAGQARQAGA